MAAWTGKGPTGDVAVQEHTYNRVWDFIVNAVVREEDEGPAASKAREAEHVRGLGGVQSTEEGSRCGQNTRGANQT